MDDREVIHPSFRESPHDFEAGGVKGGRKAKGEWWRVLTQSSHTILVGKLLPSVIRGGSAIELPVRGLAMFR